MIITSRTQFKKVLERYPDAIKATFTTDKPMEYLQQQLYNTYNRVNLDLSYAKRLFSCITPICRGGKVTGYKNVFIFSEAAALCPNCKKKGLFSEDNKHCDDCVAEAFEKEEKELE